MAVELIDNSFEVKAALNDKTIGWLHAWANEIASHAKDHCAMDGEVGSQLRGSYRADVNDGAGEAKIGTPMEAGFWEEFGTGSYAVHGDGRQGWWVYKDGYEGNGGPVLTEAEAKAIEASSDGSVHATNGRPPQYTLEKAFATNKPKAIADLQRILKELG